MKLLGSGTEHHFGLKLDVRNCELEDLSVDTTNEEGISGSSNGRDLVFASDVWLLPR